VYTLTAQLPYDVECFLPIRLVSVTDNTIQNTAQEQH